MGLNKEYIFCYPFVLNCVENNTQNSWSWKNWNSNIGNCFARTVSIIGRQLPAGVPEQ